MTNEERMSLIDSGFEVDNAEDALELTPEERLAVELRIAETREIERKKRLKARADEILLERFIPLKLSAQYDETPVLTLGEYPEWLQ